MPLEDADVKEITSRLDVLIKLIAALFVQDLSNIDAIVKLDKMQLSREQIATALGITTQNVRQQLYLSKKVDKKSKKNQGQPTSVQVSVGVVPPAEEVEQ